MNNNIVIRALYRSKLRLCNRLGYNYGDWNNHYITKNINNINYKKINRMFHKTLGGHYLMNNIRYRYKMNKYETDTDNINEHIEEGFDILKEINEIEQYYKRKKIRF
jgi:hypothetical protein